MKPLIALTAALAILTAISFTSRSFVASGADLSIPEGVLMTTTNYSARDSCHYPVKDGCLTASGTIAGEATIACPRSWSFGTRVLIEDKEYVCEDYYNSDLSDRIDIWVGYDLESYERALEFGVREVIVIIK